MYSLKCKSVSQRLTSLTNGSIVSFTASVCLEGEGGTTIFIDFLSVEGGRGGGDGGSFTSSDADMANGVIKDDILSLR